MNCYEKLSNYLTNTKVPIDYEQAKDKPFPNLLLNRFHDIINKIKFVHENESFISVPPTSEKQRAHPINMDNVNFVKDNPTASFSISRNRRNIYIIGNTVYFDREQMSIINAFENEEISFLLAFIISQRLNLKLKKDDLNPPKKDIAELINRTLLEDSFKHLKDRNYENQIKEKTQAIEILTSEIQSKKDEIKRLDDDVKKIENSLLFKTIEDDSKEIIDFIVRHQSVNKNSISFEKSLNGSKIQFHTNDLFAYKLNLAYLEKSKDRIYPDHPLFRAHLDDIIKGDTKIYVGRYIITITINSNSVEIDYRPENKDYQNPHAAIRCIGTAREAYHTAIKNFELVHALSILFEHLQALNFGDPGSNSAPTHCKLYREGVVVYDPKDREKSEDS